MGNPGSFDSKASKALKACLSAMSPADRDTAKQRIAEIEKEAPTGGSSLAEVANYFLTRKRMEEIGRPSPPPIDALLQISRMSAEKTAEIGLRQCLDALAETPVETLVRNLPIAVLDALATKRKGLLKETGEFLRSADREILRVSPALDWVVRRAKPSDLAPLVPRVLELPDRPPNVQRRSDLLAMALGRDKTGKLLTQCLVKAKESDDMRRVILETVVESAAVRNVFLNLLPKLSAGPLAALAAQLFCGWLSTVETAPSDPASTAEVVSLAGNFLGSKKRTDQQRTILDAISRHGSQLIRAGREGWVALDARDLSMSSTTDSRISAEGATLFLATLDRIPSENPAREHVAALASNLGLKPIGTIGDEVAFDPQAHADTGGGLLPGDSAVTVATGWALHGEIISKLKVTPRNG